MLEIEKLVQNITIDAESIGDMDSPNTLAEMLTRMASDYTTLGSFLHKAEDEEQRSENSLKFKRAMIQKEEISKGTGVKAAELEALIQTQPQLEEYQKLHHLMRMLFLTRQSLDKSMDALRSRLSRIKTEMEGNRHVT